MAFLILRGRVWYACFTDESGRKRRLSTGCPRRPEAMDWLLANLPAARASPWHGRSMAPTLARYAAETYLPSAKLRMRPSSHERTLRLLKHLLPAIGGMGLDGIQPDTVERYMERRRIAVGPATVNRELACLRAILTDAVRRGVISMHPLRGRVRPYREPERPIRFLTSEEEGRLLAYAVPSLRPMILLSIHTGLRKEELLNLAWADIDLKTRLLTVREGKGGRLRHVPLNDTSCHALGSIGSSSLTGYLFPGRGGEGRLAERSLYKAWWAALAKAGIKGVRWHDLRATFASRLAMAGTSLVGIARLLGHRTLAMVRRYADFSPDALQREVMRLDPPKTSRAEEQAPGP